MTNNNHGDLNNNNAYSHLSLGCFILFLGTNIGTCISAYIIAANLIKENQFITHKHGYKVTMALFQAIIWHQVGFTAVE